MIHLISQSFKHTRQTHCKIKSPYPWVLQMSQKVWAKFKSPLLLGYLAFWLDFFILGRLMMLSLDKRDHFSIISMNFILFIYFLVSRKYRKNCHCDVYIRSLLMRSQVMGWNPLEGSTKASCGKLRLGSTLPASNSRKE
jgi:hypothetical protein